MVKQERNIYCTICGRTYVDPVAAQNHLQKHNVGAQQAFVTVVPQFPRSTVGAQQTMTSLITTTGATDAAHTLSLPSHARPNPSGDVRRNTRDTTPQVAAPPRVRMTRSGTGPEKLCCPWCPHLKKFRTKANLKWHRKTYHATIYKCSRCRTEMGKNGMWKHMRDVHGATRRKRTMRKLRKRYANTTNDRNQSIPNAPTTGPPYDEGLPLSEDEESLSSDDEGHLTPENQPSSEDEQRPTPEAGVEQPPRDHQQSFGCGQCPERFLTIETLTMHMRFVHCWKCGYCQDVPSFSSFSLWREHRTTVHGIVR